MEILAFTHPSQGPQLVTGAIAQGESVEDCCERVLFEQSGVSTNPSILLGEWDTRYGEEVWGVYVMRYEGELPDQWEHRTTDGTKLTLNFFWQPLSPEVNKAYQAPFRNALLYINMALTKPEVRKNHTAKKGLGWPTLNVTSLYGIEKYHGFFLVLLGGFGGIAFLRLSLGSMLYWLMFLSYLFVLFGIVKRHSFFIKVSVIPPLLVFLCTSPVVIQSLANLMYGGSENLSPRDIFGFFIVGGGLTLPSYLVLRKYWIRRRELFFDSQ